MDIEGKTIQEGEPIPDYPCEIKNEINIAGAIEILNILKSKVTLVKVDDENNSEKEYRLPYLISIEKQAIETVLSELEKKDKEYEELLKAYKELKEIEESHRKENGKLRERVKELEEWNEYYRKEINKMSYETMCSVLTMIDYDQAEKFYKEGKDGK